MFLGQIVQEKNLDNNYSRTSRTRAEILDFPPVG